MAAVTGHKRAFGKGRLMAPRTSEPEQVAPARRKYMEELRQLREESGMSLGDLSEVTRYDRSYLSKLERGERLGDLETAKRLDEVYGTRRSLQNLWLLAKDDAYLGRYQRYMALENAARVLQVYVPQTIPGLLQTEEYAREQLWSMPYRADEEDAFEEQLVLRLDRQRILRREESAPHLRVVLDEAAFSRPLKDREAWKRQLQRLLDDAELPNVTLQVLPYATGLHGLVGGSLTILWLPDGTCAAYSEGSSSGEMIEEPEEVEQYRLAYDEVSALALSPRDSLEFIRNLMKDG
ncbi:helix-turn-helix domain-containing protein [Streptomyces sp. 8K308]|uniref:helix-turn-helix domain-containing protein n=1 Tax=Streptomyces sp. 8K308 TaxID=2530388 RepID=UPI00104E362D|nr:helix-turn-helix transcriptional regulator [Streptomyces sp. 8K308]TDC24653.1 helix-turn-helix domain-containing protein [Streptomyces sp. 8K308]